MEKSNNSPVEKKPDLYAVFESGGKQHVARLGAKLKLDLLSVEVGKKVTFDKVMLVSNNGKLAVGSPVVTGQKVEAEVLEHGKGDKISYISFKRRKHHLKRGSIRPRFTEVEIQVIDGVKAQPKPVAKPKVAKADAKPAAKADVKPAAKADAKPAAKADAKPAAKAKPDAKAEAKPKAKAAAKPEAKESK